MVTNIMDRGGIETLIMNIYRNIDRNKIQFDFLTHPFVQNYVSEYEDEIISLGGHIYKAPRFAKHPIKYWKYIRHFFIQHPEYQIVHGHNLDAAALVYMFVAKATGRFVVAHSHNTRDAGNKLKQVCLRLSRRIISIFPDYYFACSQRTGLFAYGKRICNSSKFRVVHNGIELSCYHNNNDEHEVTRKKLLPQVRGFIIGNVGRLSPQKNQSFLLKIFAEILKTNPSSTLVIIGNGDLEENLKTEAKELGISNCVIFTGSVSNVPDYLRAFDLFLFPSLYEGIALASIEAQATGLPLLISDTVDQDCVCTSAVKVMSLQQTPREWAKTCLNILGQTSSHDDCIQRVGEK
jgi:glycosyltransferase involved in cell wall biosynthesis